jgi:hypothetical protein
MFRSSQTWLHPVQFHGAIDATLGAVSIPVLRRYEVGLLVLPDAFVATHGQNVWRIVLAMQSA